MSSRYNLSKYNIRVFFSNEDQTSTFHLDYRLYDHSVAQKWMRLMQKTILFDGGSIYKDGYFSGAPINDKEALIDELNKTVVRHNEFCKQKNLQDFYIPVMADNPLTQGRLSELHEYFEKYAEHDNFKNEHEKENLQNLNLLIHALESFLNESSKNCHVEILSKQFLKTSLTEEEYGFFDPDTVWGQLVLTYGITGVPTLNAFRNDSDPTPQNVITNGMALSFWEDNTFDQHEELKKWLISKNMDPADPKNAVGYIGLGILSGLKQTNREELLKKISKHKKVTGYEFFVQVEKSFKPGDAQWPFDPEIFYHLDLVPYIDLNIKFDAKKLYEEAFKARDYFVVHRDYDQSSGNDYGKWKSLGLRSLFGDYTKTQYHTSYSYEGDTQYLNTIFAELCPETMSFLNTITDVSKCERVRFMMLEPGASINVHRDSKDRDVSLAVNISLNMPEGCEFFAQLNPDGSSNDHTVKLPFKNDGSVLLFNNAKYHRVINNSDVPRIHIIFHGPVRIGDEALLALARKQNNVFDRKDLLKKLIQKKAALGEEFNKTASLYSDWLSSGLSHDTLPDKFSLAVYDHKNYYEGCQSSHHLEIRTSPSLFPLKFDRLQEDSWDQYLKDSYNAGKEFVILIAAGTFVLDLSLFIKEVITNCHLLKSKAWPAAGHLMDFNTGKHLPYFHEQFLIINLKSWHEIGEPTLGPLFDTVEGKLEFAEISKEKIHDEYTPLYISAGPDSGETRHGLLGWGSKIIKAAVKNNSGVLNLNEGIRNSKLYGYPRDNLVESRNKIESIVLEKLNYSKNEVYCFNNEILSILKVDKLVPNKFISVAAGFKPFQIINQYQVSENASIHFGDFSTNALNYVKELTQQDSAEGILKVIYKQMEKRTTSKLSNGVPESLLKSTIRDYFKNDFNSLANSLKIGRNASFEEMDLIKNPETLADKLVEGDKFVIWTSNAFYNNQLYLILPPNEVDNVLINCVKKIASKTSLRAFRLKNSYTFVFGKGLDFIRGILTDGAAQEAQFSKEFWDEIK